VCAAVLEGVLLQMRVIVEHFAALGHAADPLLVAGGFGATAAFEQRLATTLRRPIAALADARNSTARGAAILAAVGLGVLPDFAAARSWTHRNQSLAPEASPETEERYEVFRASWADAQRLAARSYQRQP
jgi:sugar (pentulose or hexulose) kinase